MLTKGKFILFEPGEFASWLESQKISRRISLVQNHHTWRPNYNDYNTVGDPFKTQEGMERSHLERGFAEIAQHFSTFPDGRIMTGRHLDKIPAGIKGANANGICIEHVGNFDLGGDQMTDAHKDTIIMMNALLCFKFKLPVNTDTIVYHHWYDLNTAKRTNGTGSTKSCPGTNFFGGNTVDDAKKNFIPLVEMSYTAYKLQPLMQPNPLKTAEIIAAKLNVRSGPSLTSPVVKTLLKGVSVNIYEDRGGWLKIHPSEQNWISGHYVEVH